VDREMPATEELSDLRVGEDRRHELGRDLASSTRSRLVVNAVGCQTGSSIPSPTNQRNSRF
jgi:hypothetical protein